MAETMSSPIQTLPPETIGHILHLALEGDPSTGFDFFTQRRTLFALGEVCRSWSAEAARLSRFIVMSAQEARDLLATLPALRHRPRELVLIQLRGAEPEGFKAYRDLVLACPSLDLLLVWDQRLLQDGGLLPELEGGARGAAGRGVRRLELRGNIFELGTALR